MTHAYADEYTFHGVDGDKGCKLKQSRKRREVRTDEPLLFARNGTCPNPLGSRLPSSSAAIYRALAREKTPRNEKRKDRRTGPDISRRDWSRLCTSVHFGNWSWAMATGNLAENIRKSARAWIPLVRVLIILLIRLPAARITSFSPCVYVSVCIDIFLWKIHGNRWKPAKNNSLLIA